MDVTAICITSLLFEVFLLSVHIQDSQQHDFHIFTNKQQFFEYDSISFFCEGLSNLTQVKGVNRNKKTVKGCNGTTCTLQGVYESDSGEYWCETETERSSTINITITNGSVILESPAVPVSEGNNVTLRCRNKTDSQSLTSQFYKDGSLLKGGASTTMTIQNVSKSDEGLYKCSISGGGTSPESWLIVRGFYTSSDNSTVEENSTVGRLPSEVSTLMWTAGTMLIGILVLLAILALYVGFLLKKHKGAPRAPDIAVPGDDGDNENGMVYAAVFTKQRNSKDCNAESALPGSTAAEDNGQCSAEGEVVYSAVRTVKKKPETNQETETPE